MTQARRGWSSLPGNTPQSGGAGYLDPGPTEVTCVQPCLSDQPWPAGKSRDLQLEAHSSSPGGRPGVWAECKVGWVGVGRRVCLWLRSDGQASWAVPHPSPVPNLDGLTVYSGSALYGQALILVCHTPASSLCPHLCPRVEGLVLGLRRPAVPRPPGSWVSPTLLRNDIPGRAAVGGLGQTLLAGGQTEET